MNLSPLHGPPQMSAFQPTKEGLMSDMRDQRKRRATAAVRTTNGRRTSRPPTLEVSELQPRSYCGLPCLAPKLSPMRLDSLYRSAHWGPARRPGKGFSGNDRNLLGRGEGGHGRR
ncbi:hypothetical protein LY78DRAFT_60210 [Colletotrichum sublineola]|nr:hypothetical protein LY78DRAFT_60210 [Colletotrichum sublineola]